MSRKRTKTVAEVLEMRRLYRDGWSLRRLEKKYKLHHETCRKIVTGLVYRDVGEFADMRPDGSRGLSEEEVVSARDMFRAGFSLVHISAVFGRTPGHMARILTGRYPLYASIPGAIEKLPPGSVPYKPRPRKAKPMADDEQPDLPQYGQPRPLIAVYDNGARIVPGQGETVIIERCPVRIPAKRLFSHVTRDIVLPREQSQLGIFAENGIDIPVKVQRNRKTCEAFPLCDVTWGKGDYLIPSFTGDVS